MRQGRQGRFRADQRVGQQVQRVAARGIQERHTAPSRHRQPGGRGREHQQRPRHPPARTTGGGEDCPAKGWTTAMHVHETNIPQVSADCTDALRGLAEWSWEGYMERLAAKGYKLYLRKDKKDVIRGYVLQKGSARYKASELGKGRSLTASRIRQTWEKLHPEQARQSRPASEQTVIPAPKPLVSHEAAQKPQPRVQRNSPVYEDYTTWQPDRLCTEFEHDGKTYDRYIPDKVLDCLNDEFDHRELANWQALQNLAMAYFTLVASPYGEVAGGGGGGSQSDLKWGRDPEEDEIEFARRCAREASRRLGRHPKGGMKRR